MQPCCYVLMLAREETIKQLGKGAPASEPGPTASPRYKKAGIKISHSRQLPARAQSKLYMPIFGVGFMFAGGESLDAPGTLGLDRYGRWFHQVVFEIPALVLDGLASGLRLVLGAAAPN